MIANTIDSLIPRYPTFLILGLIIVVSGFFLLMGGRDVLISVWNDKLFDGDTGDGLFKAAQTAEQAIGRTLSVWFFLGLCVIQLGIGFAIATIVQNLRATGRLSLTAYSSAGLTEAANPRPQEPWLSRNFPKLLFAGILVLGFYFVLTLWWDANLVLLKNAEFDGQTSGASYNAYLMIDRVLSAEIGGGKFLGVGLLVFGILGGLATIIWNLSFQARALPELGRRALNPDNPNRGTELPNHYVPSNLLRLGILGIAVLELATPLAVIRSGFIGWSLGRQFEGSISETAIRLEGVFDRTIDPLTNVGLGILFFTIALLLLGIIRWLREQRQGFGDLVSETSGGSVPQRLIEPALWPTRMVSPLAIFGIVVVGFFFLTMTAVRDINFLTLLDFQFVGDTGNSVYQNALRLDRVLGPVIAATRFVGFSAIFLAIGLALVTIVINLRATAMVMPGGFSRLIMLARGEDTDSAGDAYDADDEEESGWEPMALAPWNLFAPLVLGAAIVVTGTLLVAIIHGWSLHRMLGEQFAGAGAAGATSSLFESTFLATNLFGASLMPWMLFGMGVILFSVGRFFSTIVGFVEARRMIIVEGVGAIAEAVTPQPEPESEPATV